MLNWKIATRSGNRLLLAALVIPISGCIAYNNTTNDWDRTPIVNTGAGASIIYPGQAPAMPGSAPPTPYAPPGTNAQHSQPTTPEQQDPYPPNAPVPPGSPPAPQPHENPQSGSAPGVQASPCLTQRVRMSIFSCGNLPLGGMS